MGGEGDQGIEQGACCGGARLSNATPTAKLGVLPWWVVLRKSGEGVELLSFGLLGLVWHASFRRQRPRQLINRQR